jgi:hypothetical protein
MNPDGKGRQSTAKEGSCGAVCGLFTCAGARIQQEAGTGAPDFTEMQKSGALNSPADWALATKK